LRGLRTGGLGGEARLAAGRRRQGRREEGCAGRAVGMPGGMWAVRDPGDADRDGRGRRVGDDVGERWGLGAERDIRPVRRWRSHDGRDVI
jgi:hypothetical protein